MADSNDLMLDNKDDKTDKTYMDFFSSNENDFTCSICGVLKWERKSIIQHLKRHDEVPKFSCGQCSRKFLFQAKYEQHIKNHEIN